MFQLPEIALWLIPRQPIIIITFVIISLIIMIIIIITFVIISLIIMITIINIYSSICSAPYSPPWGKSTHPYTTSYELP